MMVYTNEMTKLNRRPRALLEPFVLLLAPFAPHIGEELWERLGHRPSVASQSWPAFDSAFIISDRIIIPIQVNGKLRGKIDVEATAPRDHIEALSRDQVLEWLQGNSIKKVVYVEKKLINFVV
jgi:leucyl-tRNA synthetase